MDIADPKTPSDLRRDIARKLAIINRQMRKQFDSEFVGHGITRSQWGVIVLLAQVPGCTQRAIAEQLEMSEAAAGRLIERLSKNGFVARAPSQDDARANSVHLTERAKPLLDRLRSYAEDAEGRAFAGIAEDELERFNGVLDKIRANVGG